MNEEDPERDRATQVDRRLVPPCYRDVRERRRRRRKRRRRKVYSELTQ